MVRVVIAGGGTAGHAYPGVAVALSLRSMGADVTFIGTDHGPEKRLALDNGFDFESIRISGRGKGTLKNLRAGLLLATATAKCVGLLGRLDPDVVVTTGGYVGLPVAFATATHRIPLIVHEQNVALGLSNRLAARFARAVAVSFASTAGSVARARYTGNPVRPGIAEAGERAAETFATFELSSSRRTILVMGGSQGARTLNRAALGLFDLWRGREDLQLLHLTGTRDLGEVEASLRSARGADDRLIYRFLPYTEKMGLAYSAADLVVCRAGATTIAELAASHRPAILVPFPHAVEGDQAANARAVEEEGGGSVLADEECTPTRLRELIDGLIGDDALLRAMSASIGRLGVPDASERLAALVLEAAGAPSKLPSAKPPTKTSGRARLDVGWKNVHLVGIGGARMSAIARILRDAGIEVSGSDQADSSALESLRRRGVVVAVGHRADLGEGADVVINSPAVPAENPELEAARARGVRVLSGGEALAEVVRDRVTVAVAGTHGKTTTSAMIATVLEKAGYDPTYVLGADLPRVGPGGKLGSGEFAVVEADEAYGSFLYLTPHVALVSNIEEDHLDYYGSMEALNEAFARFVAKANRSIICLDDPGAAALLAPNPTTYGLDPAARVKAEDIESGAGSSAFALVVDGRAVARVELKVGGRRNVQNALGAAAACLVLGVDVAAIAEGLSVFGGTARRFEFRGSLDGADLIDDYAHLPTEIEATLKDARSGDWSRIVAVFQPHLYSRTQSLWREFGAALALADLVVVTDIYGAREEPIPGVTGKLVAEAVCDASPGLPVAYLPRLDEAADFVVGKLRPGDLVLSLGAGDITTLPERMAAGSGR